MFEILRLQRNEKTLLYKDMVLPDGKINLYRSSKAQILQLLVQDTL